MAETIITLLVIYYVLGLGFTWGAKYAANQPIDIKQLAVEALTWPKIFTDK